MFKVIKDTNKNTPYSVLFINKHILTFGQIFAGLTVI